jgi:3-oxoacyl-[acyl-carrier protein] reductase
MTPNPQTLPLQDHVALVTGASRGIGRAVARALAARGAAVALVARDAARLAEVVGEIQAAGGRALALPADLADDAALARLIPRVMEQFGKLTLLVNNAGIGIYGPFEKVENEVWDRVMRLNARAPFILCREAIAPMRAAGGGAIVNIASVVGIKGYVNQAAYTASKHAMMGFSKVLAQEVKPDRIRVHTICPGGVDTDMAGQARPDLDRSILIQPEAIAEVVVFLLTLGGNAMIDDVHIRRANGEPWF